MGFGASRSLTSIEYTAKRGLTLSHWYNSDVLSAAAETQGSTEAMSWRGGKLTGSACGRSPVEARRGPTSGEWSGFSGPRGPGP